MMDTLVTLLNADAFWFAMKAWAMFILIVITLALLKEWINPDD